VVKHILGGLAALLIASSLFVVLALPGLIEGAINRIDPRPGAAPGPAAQRLHDEIGVVDLHADPLLWKRDLLTRSDRGHVDLPRLQEGGVALQIFAAVTKSPRGQNYERNDGGSDNLTALAVAQLWPVRSWFSLHERALHQAAKLRDLDQRAGSAFEVVLDREDLRSLLEARAGGEDRVGGLFGIEGAHALEGNLENLDSLYAAGLRVVGLTHFFDNALGGSLHGVSGEGLTPFGRQVVEEADRRRMIIDIAHASPQMVRDVLKLSSRPVILSHGGFEGQCATARNLDDALMQQIAADGGLIGVGYWDGAVCDTSPRSIVASIRYGIDLLGVDHIALGSDYDGGTEVAFDTSQLSILTQTMLDDGFSEAEIRKVMGGNALAFFLAQLP